MQGCPAEDLRLGCILVTEDPFGIENDQSLLELLLVGRIEIFQFRKIAVMVAEQTGSSAKEYPGDFPAHGIGDAEHIVGDRLACVEGRVQLQERIARKMMPLCRVGSAVLFRSSWAQQPQQTFRLAVVGRHHRGILLPELAMDHGVDHRIKGHIQRRRHLFEFERVPEQDVQELVDEDGFDVLLGLAVALQESEIHVQDTRLAQRDGERLHRLGEVDTAERENRTASQRVFVDRLLQERTEVVLVNPHKSFPNGAG